MEKQCAVNRETLIPFAPSLEATRLLITGKPYIPKPGKVLARTTIADSLTLSVPIVGGSARLKRIPNNLSEIIISDHGSWRREHLGAWNASYGKTPYFSHIFPLVEDAYRNHSHGSLEEFNLSLWKTVTDFLDTDKLLPVLETARTADPKRFAELQNEFTTKVNLNYSIFDALFRLGKNVIFLL